MTGRVDDGPVVGGSEEFLVRDVDCDTALALLLQSVHHIGKAEASLASLLRFLLELVDFVLLDVSAVQQKATYCGRLPVVNVTHENYVQMRLTSVFPL